MQEVRSTHPNDPSGEKKHLFLSAWLKLLIKQTVASAVCFASVLALKNGLVPAWQPWTESLGNALRYETDFSFLEKVTERILPQDTAPIPESDAPLSEH